MKAEKSSPKYMELANWVMEQIREQKLRPGQKLYSEHELQQMFGVSRQTVRKAFAVLEKDGVIHSVRGSGTYVNEDRQTKLAQRMRVSVVTTYVDGYIFPRMIKGIENALIDQGYTLQIAFTNNQSMREQSILEDIINRDEVAGIIIETTKSALPNPNIHLYREILKRKIPILFVNSFYPELPIPHVSLNDYMVGYRLTQYLIKMGHRKIAGIFKLDDLQGRIRYSGYMDAMHDAGLELDERNILWFDTEDVRCFDNLSERLLARVKGCSAMFCYNDRGAYDTLNLLTRAGIRVPEDLSIVGVDDANLATLGEVGITTIPHPMEMLGKKAAENLLQLIRNPLFDANYEFDGEIIERESVRRWK
ncbi:MAG: GntR family transcriptional regulator [Eubacterium sp.]|nr:GntR family transcriptional regulator [Eubacterium sp.]